MRRVSLASLLGMIGLIAFGFAALRNSSEAWSGLVFMLMMGVLFASLLGVILHGRRGAGWIGFALFGWGYLVCSHVLAADISTAFPYFVSRWVFEKTNPPPVAPPTYGTNTNNPPPEDTAYDQAREDHKARLIHAEEIGFCLFVLAFSGAGSLVGSALSRRSEPGSSQDANPPQPPR